MLSFIYLFIYLLFIYIFTVSLLVKLQVPEHKIQKNWQLNLLSLCIRLTPICYCFVQNGANIKIVVVVVVVVEVPA